MSLPQGWFPWFISQVRPFSFTLLNIGFVGLTLLAIIYLTPPFCTVRSMKEGTVPILFTAAFLGPGTRSGYALIVIDWLIDK